MQTITILPATMRCSLRMQVGRAALARLLFAMVCGLIFLIATIAPAWAQDTGPAPTIDRDRIDRQEPGLPRVQRPAETPRPAVVVAPGTEAAAPVAGQQALLNRVYYDGASLPAAKLDAATAPYIGRPLTQETLQNVANAISATYAKSDIAFYSVAILPQVPTGGALHVTILEGRIADYKLAKTSPSMPERLIDAQAQRLMRDKPTHKRTLERTLSLLRDIPGQTVEAGLKRTDRPDELTLDLDVKRKQVEITLNVNNNGVTNVTDGVQAQLAVAINGLLREGDSTRLSGYLPFTPGRYQFYSAGHSTPIGSNGTQLSINGAYVRTRTRDGIEGDAKQLGIGITHPLIRSYRRNLTLSLSLDGINSENYYLDTAFGGFRTRALRAGGAWSSIDKTGGYAVSAVVSQGLNALGTREIPGYSDKSFRKINVQLTAVKEVGKKISIKATSRMQYSKDRLPTTERFSLGGEGAGLAFDIGTLTAESGIAAGVELSWKVLGTKTSTRGLTLFAYADGALAHTKSRDYYRLPADDYSLASAGAGVRISPLKGWTASAQIAVPVKRPFDSYSEKARFFFSINRTV